MSRGAGRPPAPGADPALPARSPEAERARPRQPRPGAPMEGHSVAHNSKRHYHDAFVAMSRMRQRGLLCDVVLRVAATEIRAHKVVLASCSPYFHAMFTSKYHRGGAGSRGCAEPAGLRRMFGLPGLCGPPGAVWAPAGSVRGSRAPLTHHPHR